MPLAVLLRVDAASSARVAAMRAAVTQEPPHHAPHITLVVASERVDAPALADDLRAAVVDWTPMRLGFAAIALFPGDVLWLAPAPTARLLEWHMRISALLPSMEVDPRYRPGAWVPHLTLAQDLTIDSASDAVRALSSGWQPFTAELDRIELVRFAPVSVLWQHALMVRPGVTAAPPQD